MDLHSNDQLFADGTFDVCPNGVKQMVSLLVKKHNWSEAIPVVHTMLKKSDEQAYRVMWRNILTLATNDKNNICILKNLEIYITIDFELAMHNAVRNALPNAKIRGCLFHMKQSIFRNIGRNRFGSTIKKDMEDKMKRDDLRTRLNSLCNCETLEQFINERTNFISYYQMITGYESFLKYMVDNWLGSNSKHARFSYKLWTKLNIPSSYELEMTNNPIENFHRNINKRFSSKPDLKRSIQLMLQIEEDAFTKKSQFENRVSIASNPSSLVNSSKRKRNTTGQNDSNKRMRIPVISSPAMPQVTLPVPTTGNAFSGILNQQQSTIPKHWSYSMTFPNTTNN